MNTGQMQRQQCRSPLSEAPWPGEVWGLKLGRRVSNIRQRGDYIKNEPERRAELDTMGFRWCYEY